MKEWTFKTDISDVRLSVFLFDDSFELRRMSSPRGELMSQLALHQHTVYEIFFAINSLDIVSELESKRFLNEAVVIPPQLNHYAVSERTSAYSLYFSISPSKRSGELYKGLISKISEGMVCVPICENINFYLNRISQMMRSEGFVEQVEHLIHLLFSEIFYGIVPHKKSLCFTTENSKHINTLDNYISSHYCENVHLEDIAKELYLCPKQVSRIIKKVYGCSLSELVHEKRLKVACRLLKYSEMPISAIAAGIGYEYENYFFTRFKKTYGITPLEYRERSKGKFIEKQ